MVTTKEIGIEYTQKKMRKTFKHFTAKDNTGNEEQNYQLYKKQTPQ